MCTDLIGGLGHAALAYKLFRHLEARRRVGNTHNHNLLRPSAAPMTLLHPA